MVYHLAPTGVAGFVLANGSMSSNQSGEGEIRKNLIEADLVDCMVALPGQLFYSTQIPACLWFLARDKKDRRFRDRRGQTLFIDARYMGAMADRVHAELTEDEIGRIARVYHSWRGDAGSPPFQDLPGFARSATIEDIRYHRFALVPGRYVGFAEQLSSTWSNDDLSREIAELRSRLDQVARASEAAMATIWEVLDG